eukprot:Opistho-1_new@37974
MPSASATSSDSGAVVVDPPAGARPHAHAGSSAPQTPQATDERPTTSTAAAPPKNASANNTGGNANGNAGGGGGGGTRGSRRESAPLGGEGAANVHQRSLQIASMGLYDLSDTLGKGEYSVVRVATQRITGSRLAMKMLDKERLEDKALQMFFREVQIMKHLRHPNIVRMFEVFDTRRELCLVLEVAGKGDVLDYILEQPNKRLTEEESRRLFHQMLLAVDYCHRKRIFHRDLKAENFLLDDDYNIKLSDFGFANRALPGETLKTFCGSPPYAAPEIHGKQEYNGRCADMWSMGVLLYVLVSGKFPFQGKDMKDAIMNARYRTLWHVSEACRDVIRGLLIVRPSRRMTLSEVMESAWMKEGGFSPPSDRERSTRGSSISLDTEGRMVVSVPVLEKLEGLGYARDDVIRALQDNLFGPVAAMYNLLLLGSPLDSGETISVPFKAKTSEPTELKTVAEHRAISSSTLNSGNATKEGIAAAMKEGPVIDVGKKAAPTPSAPRPPAKKQEASKFCTVL